MLFYKKISKNATLGIWRVDESTEQLRAMLGTLTLGDEQFTIITNEKRQKEWLATRTLLKELCGEEKRIIYSETGKPFLSDNAKISISHSKNFVAVLVSQTNEVGIDIEQRTNRAFRLKERFMSEKELSTLLPDTAETTALIIWSAKETLFKILPETEIDFIRHLHCSPFILQEKGSFLAVETRSERHESFEIHYQVFADFVLTYWGM